MIPAWVLARLLEPARRGFSSPASSPPAALWPAPSIPLGLNTARAFSPFRIAISSRNCWICSACRWLASISASIRPNNGSISGVRSASGMSGSWIGVDRRLEDDVCSVNRDVWPTVTNLVRQRGHDLS